MSMLRRAAPALSLALLLSSTAGLVVHDHSSAVERRGYECTVDHEQGPAAPSNSAPAGLHAAGQRHHHQCLGCHLSSHRSLVASDRGVAIDASRGQERPDPPPPAPRASFPWTGRTLRGPPPA